MSSDQTPQQYSERWEQVWKTLQPGERFDAKGPAPSLITLLETRKDLVDCTGKRVFIPGCGRGYDNVLFALQGAKEALGLELAPTAVEEANAYIRKQLGSNDVARVVRGDFYEWSSPEGAFELGYDYTFLCAMRPDMREDWAAGWARHLAPGGRLITLIFPDNPKADPGPPWYIYPDLVKTLLTPHGFELLSLEKVPEEQSHEGRKGEEWMAVWEKR